MKNPYLFKFDFHFVLFIFMTILMILDFASMGALDECPFDDCSYDADFHNIDRTPFTMINIIGNIKTKILFLDVTSGFGLSSFTSPSYDNVIAPVGESVTSSKGTVIIDASYPILSGDKLNLDVYFRAQETLGAPGTTEGTSDIIGLGAKFSYILN